MFGNYNKGKSGYKMISDLVLTGMETYHGDIKVYLYGEFSVPGKLQVIQNGQLADKNEIEGETVKEGVLFAAGSPEVVELRYALSYVSST